MTAPSDRLEDMKAWCHRESQGEDGWFSHDETERVKWLISELEQAREKRDEYRRYKIAALTDLLALKAKLAEAEQVLELIAAPPRADGSYNRSREACGDLARECLKKIGDQDGQD